MSTHCVLGMFRNHSFSSRRRTIFCSFKSSICGTGNLLFRDNLCTETTVLFPLVVFRSHIKNVKRYVNLRSSTRNCAALPLVVLLPVFLRAKRGFCHFNGGWLTTTFFRTINVHFFCDWALTSASETVHFCRLVRIARIAIMDPNRLRDDKF